MEHLPGIGAQPLNRRTRILRTMLDRPRERLLALGLAGGLAGTALMDIVMVITFVLVGEKADAFFTMVGERLGGGAVLGLGLHNLVGASGGLVFSVLVLWIRGLRIDTMRRGLAYGLAAGALTIPLGCIPLAIWLGQPIMSVIAFSLMPHLVWGLTLGWMVAYGLLKWRTVPPHALSMG